MSEQAKLAKPPWKSIVFVCSKCTKRQDRRNFRSDLKRALKARGSTAVRVVACACLDVCPGRAITLAIAHDLAGDRPLLRIVDRKHDVESLAEEIGSGIEAHILSVR